MVMDPNQYPNTGYVDPGQNNNYTQPSQPLTMRAKILVMTMIFGVLILVIGGFLIISSRKDPNLGNMENVLAIHAEIVRVSEAAYQSGTISPSGKNLASTAQLVATSNQNAATKIITKEFNGKADKKIIASARDQGNDDKLKQGELLGSTDKAFQKILKDLLTKANAAIASVSSSERVEVQLKEMAESNEIISNSIKPSS